MFESQRDKEISQATELRRALKPDPPVLEPMFWTANLHGASMCPCEHVLGHLFSNGLITFADATTVFVRI